MQVRACGACARGSCTGSVFRIVRLPAPGPPALALAAPKAKFRGTTPPDEDRQALPEGTRSVAEGAAGAEERARRAGRVTSSRRSGPPDSTGDNGRRAQTSPSSLPAAMPPRTTSLPPPASPPTLHPPPRPHALRRRRIQTAVKMASPRGGSTIPNATFEFREAAACDTTIRRIQTVLSTSRSARTTTTLAASTSPNQQKAQPDRAEATTYSPRSRSFARPPVTPAEGKTSMPLPRHLQAEGTYSGASFPLRAVTGEGTARGERGETPTIQPPPTLPSRDYIARKQ